jgi:hypothetical protein
MPFANSTSPVSSGRDVTVRDGPAGKPLRQAKTELREIDRTQRRRLNHRPASARRAPMNADL